MYFLYNALLYFSLLFLIPYYGLKILCTGKYRKSIGPKLGFVPADTFQVMTGRPRIWLHAVSVGEVTAAAPIIQELREYLPDACIVLSTSTETGQTMARSVIAGVTAFIYFPLDFPFVVQKAIKQVNPDVFGAVETELWPNFIAVAEQQGIRILLLNGRISPRSFKRYCATRFFWKKILGMIDGVGAISETDADRLKVLGVASSRLQVLGNAKYDSLASRTDPRLHREIAEKLNIQEKTDVFVAGSTHSGEEEIILNVYRGLLESYPDMILVLVPRHIERAPEVLKAAAMAGFSDCICFTDILAGRIRDHERIIIIDKIGELFKIYSLASIVFCGGSLVPRGGQNILEAAAWGKPVFFGPHMDDFSDEKKLLEAAGTGITVRNEKEFFDEALRLMANSEERHLKGEAGRKVIDANKGAAGKYARLILSFLKG